MTTFYPPNVQVLGKPPDEHPIYNAIGRIASEWSHVEHLLDVLIWELAGLERRTGACITSQMVGHAPRFFAIIALLVLKKRDTRFVERAQELLRRCYDLADERNRFVHDAWYVVQNAGEDWAKSIPHQYKGPERKALKTKPKAGKSPSLQFEHIPVDDAAVAGLIKKIRDMFSDIAKLRGQILA